MFFIGSSWLAGRSVRSSKKRYCKLSSKSAFKVVQRPSTATEIVIYLKSNHILMSLS